MRLAQVTLVVLVLVQLPAFLCMGLDSDISMYDVVARRVMLGDVHYRDLLETNFPGIVWLHMAVRSLFGWRSEALRAVDFAAVAAAVWLLVRWLPESAPGWGRPALAAVLFAYYLSTSEWCHCQRDTWMLLPALVALNLRARRVLLLQKSPPREQGTERALACAAGLVGAAILEGAAWGVAVWIKPFVVVPALACWLLSARQARGTPGLGKRLAADLVGLLAGGLAVGAAGVGWLVGTGAWPAFVEVMFVWNREYITHNVFGEEPLACLLGFLTRNMPWILVHLAAVPVALAALWRGEGERGVPPLLAGFYLGWLAQAVLLQHPFDYVHVPPVLLGLTVAGIGALDRLREPSRWAVPAAALCVAWAVAPLLARRAADWAECAREGSTAAVRDRVTLLGRVRWAELGRVADFLRGQAVGDGELTSFSLPTVELYRELDLRPSTRYLFLQDHLDIFASRRPRILEALAASRQRFVVCDLRRYGMGRMRDALDGSPGAYEWAERVAFRAGDYVVFRVSGSEMPAWLASHFGR